MESRLVRFLEEYMGKEQAEIALYGLYQLGLSAIGILISVFFGLCFGKAYEVILFLLFFVPLRTYAGGYHTKYLWQCAVLSICIILAVIMLSCVGNTDVVWRNGIMLISAFIIFLHAPADSENKRLFQHEINRYRRIVRLMIIVTLLVYYVAEKAGFVRIRDAIIWACVVEGISIIGAKLHDRRSD